MRVGVLIFSRFDSTRLPGKALMDINGRELLGRVIDRAKSLIGVEGIAVATTGRGIDDTLVDFALSEGLAVYRGDKDDVAQRAIDACHHFGWDAFVRICGDRPFCDAAIMNEAILSMREDVCDLVTTSGDYPLPPGLTTEVVLVRTLERFCKVFQTAHKEHLTSFFYQHADDFSIRHIDYPSISRDVFTTRLVVDTYLDLERCRWIAEGLEAGGACPDLSSLAALNLAASWDRLRSKQDK